MDARVKMAVSIMRRCMASKAEQCALWRELRKLQEQNEKKSANTVSQTSD